MYHLLTGLYSQWTEKPQFNVLLLGTSASGKTAWLDRVRAQVTGTEPRVLSRITPTVGQNVVDLRLRYAILHFWDLGGDAQLRTIWQKYYEEAQALVWATNAADWAATCEVPAATEAELEAQRGQTEASAAASTASQQDEAQATRRRNESWEILAELRKNSHLASLPLLIIMTKADELTPSQLDVFEQNIRSVIALKIPELNSNADREDDSPSDWNVIVCSAKAGHNVDRFVDWLHLCAQRNTNKVSS